MKTVWFPRKPVDLFTFHLYTDFYENFTKPNQETVWFPRKPIDLFTFTRTFTKPFTKPNQETVWFPRKPVDLFQFTNPFPKVCWYLFPYGSGVRNFRGENRLVSTETNRSCLSPGGHLPIYPTNFSGGSWVNGGLEQVI